MAEAGYNVPAWIANLDLVGPCKKRRKPSDEARKRALDAMGRAIMFIELYQFVLDEALRCKRPPDLHGLSGTLRNMDGFLDTAYRELASFHG